MEAWRSLGLEPEEEQEGSARSMAGSPGWTDDAPEEIWYFGIEEIASRVMVFTRKEEIDILLSKLHSEGIHRGSDLLALSDKALDQKLEKHGDFGPAEFAHATSLREWERRRKEGHRSRSPCRLLKKSRRPKKKSQSRPVPISTGGTSIATKEHRGRKKGRRSGLAPISAGGASNTVQENRPPKERRRSGLAPISTGGTSKTGEEDNESNPSSRQGIGKDPEQVFDGKVSSYNARAGFGFIACDALFEIFGCDVFVHRNFLPQSAKRMHFCAGNNVKFTLNISTTGQPQVKHLEVCV